MTNIVTALPRPLRRDQIRQPRLLLPRAIEIPGREPRLMRPLQRRPFLVGDGEPGGAAVAAAVLKKRFRQASQFRKKRNSGNDAMQGKPASGPSGTQPDAPYAIFRSVLSENAAETLPPHLTLLADRPERLRNCVLTTAGGTAALRTSKRQWPGAARSGMPGHRFVRRQPERCCPPAPRRISRC